VDGVDDLGAVDPLQLDRRDPEVGVPKLSLDHHQRDPLVSHLDRVGVPPLVRREPPPNTSYRGGVPALLSGC
jgi:hypothetical protein